MDFSSNWNSHRDISAVDTICFVQLQYVRPLLWNGNMHLKVFLAGNLVSKITNEIYWCETNIYFSSIEWSIRITLNTWPCASIHESKMFSYNKVTKNTFNCNLVLYCEIDLFTPELVYSVGNIRPNVSAQM